MAPDNPKPTDPKDQDRKFIPSVPDLAAEAKTNFEYKELTREQETQLIDDLIERKGRDVEKHYGVYVLEANDPASKLARSLEAEVFGAFFNNDPDLMTREYSAYEEASTFLLVVDHEGKKAAGVMRLIGNSPAGFKSLVDLPRYWGGHYGEPVQLDQLEAENGLDGWDMDKVWDIATLGVQENYQKKTLTSAVLFHSVYQLSLAAQKENWVAILDKNVLEKVMEPNGIFFNVYKYQDEKLPPKNYLNALSYPVFVGIDDAQKGLDSFSPDLHDFLAKGHGLEVDYSLPKWQDEL